MTRIHNFGESFEMYLKAVDELREGEAAVPIPAVAGRLGVSTVSASEMIHRLQEVGLIRHQPYKGVHLTDAGQSAANEVLRSHRLWEVFLVDRLQVGWVEAHAAACDLEHVASDAVTDALDEYLGRPARCPHGNPIPRSGEPGSAPHQSKLSDLPPGSAAVIHSIRPESEGVLRALESRGLLPGTEVTIQQSDLPEGEMAVSVRHQLIPIGRSLAAHLRVATVARAEGVA